MEKLLFGTRAQAQAYAYNNGYTTDTKPTAVSLTYFQSEEGSPDTFSGETNALIARDENDNIVAFLAYWE